MATWAFLGLMTCDMRNIGDSDMGHGHFLKSTGQNGHFLKSTGEIGTPIQTPYIDVTRGNLTDDAITRTLGTAKACQVQKWRVEIMKIYLLFGFTAVLCILFAAAESVL